jgi:hypothetical protein
MAGGRWLARLAWSEAERKDSTMNDQPDTDPRPAAEGEPLKLTEMKRSAGHVAVQAAEAIGAIAGGTVAHLATKDLYEQVKGALGSKGDGSKSNDSKD